MVGGHRVDPSLLRVAGAAGETRLEAKSMQVLVYLARHPGRAVSRPELEQEIWPGRIVTEDAVTNAIGKLRRAFGDDARRPQIIETIPKSGYRLIAEVEPLGETEGALAASPPRPLRAWDATRRLPWGLITVAALLVASLLAAEALLRPDHAPSDHRAVGSARPAVAILPFENLGVSPDQDYFANGITADLITDLSKLSGLLVIAPGTVFAYHGSAAGARQIFAELNVDYVVVGSVQRSAERLRANVQLIDGHGAQALWAERYEGSLEEVFTVQDRLAAGLISALRIELAPTEREFLARRPTESVAAYDRYLRGLEAHGHRSPAQNLVAREWFREALALDPTFARAYAGLALTHARDAIDGWVSTPKQSLEQAAELASAAAALDPSLPQVHFVSGQVDLFRRRHPAAIAATERAIDINPNYADAYALRAWVLNYAGRSDEAVLAMEQALRLNPRPTASYLEVLGEIHYVQGRYAESAAVFERVLDINPNYVRARMWLAAALAQAGALEEATWQAEELAVLSPDLTLAHLDFAFPFKDRRVLEGVLAGLRSAGLPE